MKKYKLETANGSKYKYVSFSMDYSRPEEYLADMEKELCRKQFEGSVLFDLLLCNGFNSQRYVTSYFNGRNFLSGSFSTLGDSELDDGIRRFTCKFYASKKELLEQSSLLSKAQKFLIRKMYLK